MASTGQQTAGPVWKALPVLAGMMLLTGCATPDPPRQPAPAVGTQCEVRDGGIVRGPTGQKHIALIFTGHEFADGADVILRELDAHRGHASFFLTGTFLAHAPYQPFIQRMHAEGHYIGPHSNRHLLYCEWDKAKTTRVKPEEFASDLMDNVAGLKGHGVSGDAHYFVPSFEHYNAEIVEWSAALGWTLINYTPGTRSNADYTGEADANFVSSEAILESIVRREQDDPHGLNGFLLLLHVGSGPGRSDKFHRRFGELLDHLTDRGYEFVRVDQLLANPEETVHE